MKIRIQHVLTGRKGRFFPSFSLSEIGQQHKVIGIAAGDTPELVYFQPRIGKNIVNPQGR